MYSRFNVNLDSTGFLKDYYEIGRAVLKDNQIKLHAALDFYTNGNGIIDGGKLQEDWFSTIPVDVFISHSHKDVDIAISFAGWLHKELGLSSFVDSCLWGYIGDLLTEINDRYNLIHAEPNRTKTYDHQGAINASTHVDAMLSMSLNKMIQHSEAVFFLNTDNSVITSKNYPDKPGTYSPWIYLELSIANTIAITPPKRPGLEYRTDDLEHKLLIQYPVNLTEFRTLNNAILSRWKFLYQVTSNHHPLDILYNYHRYKIAEGHVN